MRKLKLDVETLSVESFDPAATEPEVRGTVAAHWSFVGTCGVATCQPGGTCAHSCGCTNDPRRCL